MGRRRRKSQFDSSLASNSATWRMYAERMMELSISMFDWVNLPPSVDARFLELVLFQNGSAVFFKDTDLATIGLSDEQTEDGTYLALPVMMNGTWDVYNVPMARRAYASNNYQKQLTNKDSVIIYNNMIHTNAQLMCEIYARRLWNLDRIIDVNANAQKTPVMLRCDEQQRLTALNAFKEWDGNQPVIYGDKNFDMNTLSVLRTDAPYVADKIYQLKTQIWNEALTYLGISNVNYQKKERMISDEVLRNQGGTIASRYSRLNMRRQAVEQINDMFGLDIEVNYREDYREMDDEVVFNGMTGNGGVGISAIDLRTN